MRYTFILLAILLACEQPNKLEEKEQTLQLSYIAWACACANWATQEDMEKYAGDDVADSLAAHCIYLEAADSSVKLPSLAWGSDDVISFTGKFYLNKGVPEDMQSEQRPEKARIFRYTKYEIVRSDVSAALPGSDTFVVNTKAALIYLPDSLQEEKRKKLVGEDNYRIGRGDDASGMHEADVYLESVKLPILTSDGKHFLKFIQSNGAVTVIKTDTLPSLWGMYFFDPAKGPKEVDYFDIEKEYINYFNIR